MGERKVLNKYYAPDFDPAKIRRKQQPKNQQMMIRMMLPMTIQCGTCGDYNYGGKKFNSRKENVIGETYLGIKLFRFYFNCSNCSAEITIKTDPQSSHYVVELGGCAVDVVTGEEKQRKKEDEMGDAIKCLEKRTLDSKREIDIMAALDELKSMKSRQATVSVDAMLEALHRTPPVQGDNLEKEEDEAHIKSIFQDSKQFVRRIDDEDLDDDGDSEALEKLKKRKICQETDYLTKANKFNLKTSTVVRVSVTKKQYEVSRTKLVEHQKPEEEKKKKQEEEEQENSGLQSLCQQYDSDEDD